MEQSAVSTTTLHGSASSFADLLLHSIGDAVIATDPAGRIILWNAAAERLYGYAEAEAIDRMIFDLTVPDLSQTEGQEIMARLRQGETWEGEFLVCRKDGSTFAAEVKDVPVIGEDGELEAIIGISRDLTPFKDVERQNLELIDQLRKANEIKANFLGLISHELKSPITNVLGFAELLNKRFSAFSQEDIEEALREVLNGARRLNRTVSDLLALTRLETLDELDLEPVSLPRMVEGVVSRFREESGDNVYSIEADPALPPASAEPAYLDHVFSNLLSNARKYSPPNAPIEICVEDKGAMIQMSIKDRGIGLGAEELQKIFERFYRAPNAASTSGTGLGLSVCKTLIEAQGGRIWAESREGGGTVFHFTLPKASLPFAQACNTRD